MRRFGALLISFVFSPGCSCSERVVFDEDAAASAWEEVVTCPPTGNPRVVVTNSGDDSVSFIDLVNFTVCSAPVGHLPPEPEGPHHGAALSDGSAFFVGLSNYVPGTGSGPHGSHGQGDVKGYLLKYGTETLELLDDTLVDRSPGDVRLTPDERYVLQSHFDRKRVLDFLSPSMDAAPESPNSTLAVMDPTSMSRVAMIEVCPSAHGIGLAADSSTAYVSCFDSDQIAVVSLAEPWDQVELFKVGPLDVPLGNPAYGPYAVSVEEGPPRRIWVSSTEAQDVRIFEATPPYAQVAGSPVGIGTAAFFGDFWQNYFVVPGYGTATLHFIDTTSLAVTTMQLPMQTQFEPDAPNGCLFPHVAMVIDDTRILVACEGDHPDHRGTVLDVDPGANPSLAATRQVIPVGFFPDDLILLNNP